MPVGKAGLAAALLNASQQLCGALGLAVFSAIVTSCTHHLLATDHFVADALASRFQRALPASSIVLLAAAVAALRASNTRGKRTSPPRTPQPEPIGL